MKTRTKTRTFSKEWENIMPVKGYPIMKYREDVNIDKMIKDMGWKKNGRRTP